MVVPLRASDAPGWATSGARTPRSTSLTPTASPMSSTGWSSTRSPRPWPNRSARPPDDARHGCRDALGGHRERAARDQQLPQGGARPAAMRATASPTRWATSPPAGWDSGSRRLRPAGRSRCSSGRRSSCSPCTGTTSPSTSRCSSSRSRRSSLAVGRRRPEKLLGSPRLTAPSGTADWKRTPDPHLLRDRHKISVLHVDDFMIGHQWPDKTIAHGAFR